MKTKEEIIKQMVDVMPFRLSENLVPYIYEAMEIYTKQQVKDDVVLPDVINWVDAKKRLPESWGEDYLTCRRNKNKEDGIWIYDVVQYEGEWARPAGLEDIIYWAELPKKPCL